MTTIPDPPRTPRPGPLADPLTDYPRPGTLDVSFFGQVLLAVLRHEISSPGADAPVVW